MNTIQSIFSVSANAARVSFLTRNGSFAYRGVNYAYIIRPTLDGAAATLRISRALLNKFIMAYWPKTQKPKMKDLELMESGFGWHQVHSMSEHGDASVHRFFLYLNRWMLAQQAKASQVAAATTSMTKRSYTLMVEKVGKTLRILDALPPSQVMPAAPHPQSQQQAAAAPSADRLHALVKAVNGRYGHMVH